MRQQNKKLIVVVQVAVIAIAFFFISGLFASFLYVLGEVSFAEVMEYLEILAGSESVSVPVFIEGLFWVVFKKNRKQVRKWK